MSVTRSGKGRLTDRLTNRQADGQKGFKHIYSLSH